VWGGIGIEGKPLFSEVFLMYYPVL